MPFHKNAYKYAIRQVVKKRTIILKVKFMSEGLDFRQKQCWNTNILSGHFAVNV